MNFADERYVRLFVRDTAGWVRMSWEARGLFCLLLLRVVDRAGVLDMGDEGVDGLAALLRAPGDVVERVVAEWTSPKGPVTRNGNVLVVPKFVEAQGGPARRVLLDDWREPVGSHVCVRLKTPAERAAWMAQDAERTRVHRELMADVKAKRALRFVYFVQAGVTGPVKIGFSRNPAARLAQLQVGHPETLRILAQVAGDKHLERELHERFAAHRLEGEWFKPATELLEHIEACRRPSEGA